MTQSAAPSAKQPAPPPSDWRTFIPKSVTVLVQKGYTLTKLRADAVAGLTVAIVAAPLGQWQSRSRAA